MFISFHLPKAFQTADNLCYLRSLTALTLPGSVFSQHQEQTQSLAARPLCPSLRGCTMGRPFPWWQGESRDGVCVCDFDRVIPMQILFLQSTRVSFPHSCWAQPLGNSSCSTHLDKSWPISSLHRRLWRRPQVSVDDCICFLSRCTL